MELPPPKRGLLVGRDRELAVLAAALDGLAGGLGCSILVEGEPGIGKTALLDAALAGVDPAAVDVARGQCDELGRRFPLSVVLTALRVEVDSADPLRSATAAALAGPARAARSPWSPRVGAGDAAAIATERLMELVDRLCAVRPVLLVLDDLQLADEVSLLLWRQLSRAAGQLPLALLAASRPDPYHAELESLRTELERAAHGTVLPLQPLAEPGVLELAGRLARGRPGPRLAALLTSTAGNPLYVRELVDTMARSGTLTVADGTADLRSDTESDASGEAGFSLTDAIADRLDFLSPSCRDVLRFAAVQGAEFTAQDVSALTGLDGARLRPAFDEAARAGVIQQDGLRLRFRHGLICQALYDSMPKALRLAMYRDAAMHLIESGSAMRPTAEAVLRALETADGWELDWLAANAAELAYQAPQVAAELLEHALCHADVGDRTNALEDLLADVLFRLARFDEAQQAARRILAVTAEPERRGRAAWILVYALSNVGRHDEAAELAAAEAANAETSPLWRARMSAVHATILLLCGRAGEVAPIAQHALAEGVRLGNDTFTMGYAQHSLARSHLQIDGDVAKALACCDRALELVGDEPMLVDLRVLMLSTRLALLQRLGRSDEIPAALGAALALAERSVPGRNSTVLAQTALYAFNHGPWDDAIAAFDTLAEAPDRLSLAVIAYATTARIMIHRGETREAERRLAALGPAPMEQNQAKAHIIAAHAIAAEHQGRRELAIELLAPLIGPPDPELWGTRPDLLPRLARLALDAGDPDTARSAAAASQEDADRSPGRHSQSRADWCRGLVDGDPRPVLETARYQLGVRLQLDAGNAFEDAAYLFAQRGDLQQARDALTQAQTAYAGLGAFWDSQRASARLRAFGVQLGVHGPRQRPRVGWEALSETERRVAVLAAGGLSSPDIAVRLLLSRRTVQTHVSHIFTKLGVRSRREIGALIP